MVCAQLLDSNFLVLNLVNRIFSFFSFYTFEVHRSLKKKPEQIANVHPEIDGDCFSQI